MKLSRRSFLKVVGVAGAAAGLAACGSSESTTTSTSTSTSTTTSTEEAVPAPDQALNYGTDTWPAGFDPHTISAIAATRVFNHVYETLLCFNSDMTLGGVLAESWEVVDDMTYLFNLRQGVTFHNGNAMTAADVKYSFDRIQGKGDYGDIGALGSSASYYADVTVEVIDDYTVQLSLTTPNAAFLSTLTSGYGSIVCADVVDANDGSLSTIESMCGTGPFMYSESVVDNYMKLVKNPSYWDAEEPKLDSVTFYLLADTSARLAALRTGDINICTLSSMELEDVDGDDTIQVKYYQSNNYTFLGMNLSNAALQDINVRQAMSLAVDRDAIIDYVHNGAAVQTTFVPPAMGIWSWDAVNESPLYVYDVDAAKALMEASGYSDSNRLSLKLAAGLLDSIRDTAVVLQQQLKEIYIDVEISNLESGDYVDQWYIMATTDADYDLMCGQNGAGTDPSRSVAFFYGTGAGANVWGYSNTEVDDLCAQGLATIGDDDTRASYYIDAQKIIVDECPNLWFASPTEYFFMGANVQGFEPFAANANDLSTVYISE
ncbi:MAG: ABC transporter substrate-binding protein [Faecalibacterium sp.]